LCKHFRNNIKIYKWGARRDEHIQDKSLHEFGDRVIKMEERDTFLHSPTRDEVILSLEEVGFILIEGILRSELCEESEEVKKFSTDCVLWLVQKP